MTFFQHGILSFLHSIKNVGKQYKFFIVLYSNDTKVSIYSDLKEVSNKLVFFIDNTDKIEIATSTLGNDYNFVDGDLQLKFIDDHTLFNDTSSIIPTDFYLYVSKLIKWALIPHKNLLGINNSFTYNCISMGYTNDLITNVFDIPTNGILVASEVLTDSVTKSLKTYDNTVINVVLSFVSPTPPLK